MTLLAALALLLSAGLADPAHAQALPPAAPPLTVEAPAHPGDTVRLGDVCVLGIVPDGRTRTKCCSCYNNSVHLFLEEIQPTGFLTIQPVLPRVPGAQVTPHSGAPGDWATVRLRGGSSLATPDQPLYVVDGVPALNADFQPGAVLQAGFSLGSAPEAARPGANPLLALPLEDIDHLTVLSGGVAVARYGAQGSNGVIEITTKRGGKPGQPQALRVRYAAFGGVQEVRRRYDLLSARQYADLANETSPGPPPYPPGGPVTPNTDWQGELFRPAVLHQHHLTLDGSRARTRYLASADYLNQQGVVRHSGLERYALRLNLDQQVGRRLRLSLNTAAVAIGQALPVAGTVAQALLAPPTVAVRDGQGNFQRYGVGGAARNPVELATTAGTRTTTRRLLVQARAEYTGPAGLVLSGTVSREEARVAGSTQFPADTSPQYPAPVTSALRLPTTATIAQLQLTYNRTLTTDHRLELTATTGYQHYRRSTATSYHDYLGTTSRQTTATSSFFTTGLLASYTYHDRYEALVSLRRDVSRNAPAFFPTAPATQWLPAAEVRWQLHHEPFMAPLSVLSTATLWVSAGQTSTAGLPATDWGGGVGPVPGPTVTQPAPAGPAPRTTQLEAGLNLGLWQMRLDATVFRRHTAHLTVPQLLGQPTGPGSGAQAEPRGAALRNQGLLLGLSAFWQRGELKGSSRLAATWQQQRVVAVPELPGAGDVPGLVVGEAPHPFFLYRRLPVPALGQPAAGTLRYEDRDGSGSLTAADARYQGTALPTQLYTLSQTLNWRRWSFDAQLEAMTGQQLLNTTLARLDLPTGATNGTTRLLDRWTPTHYSADIPQANPALADPSSRPQRYDDAQLQSAAHLRLTQLSVSYALRPATGPHPLSVWVGAQNLLVLTGYRGFDPNVSSGGATLLAAGYDTNYYPVARTWLLGVRATL